MNVNCIDLENEAAEKVQITNINTACELSLSATGAPVVSGAVPGEISLTGVTTGSGKSMFLVSVPACPAVTSDDSSRELMIVKSSKIRKSGFTSAALETGKFYNVMYKMTDVIYRVLGIEVDFLRDARITTGQQFPVTAKVFRPMHILMMSYGAAATKALPQ